MSNIEKHNEEITKNGHILCKCGHPKKEHNLGNNALEFLENGTAFCEHWYFGHKKYKDNCTCENNCKCKNFEENIPA